MIDVANFGGRHPQQGGIVVKRIGVVATFIVMASFVVAVSYNSHLSAFNGLYGTSGKVLDTCVTCHDGGYSFNAYGADYRAKFNELGGDKVAALHAVEPFDSDHDGYSNIVEINAGTFPGNPASDLPVEDCTWGNIKSLYE